MSGNGTWGHKFSDGPGSARLVLEVFSNLHHSVMLLHFSEDSASNFFSDQGLNNNQSLPLQRYLRCQPRGI